MRSPWSKEEAQPPPQPAIDKSNEKDAAISDAKVIDHETNKWDPAQLAEVVDIDDKKLLRKIDLRLMPILYV